MRWMRRKGRLMPALTGVLVVCAVVTATFAVAGTSGAAGTVLRSQATRMCLADFSGSVVPDICDSGDPTQQWTRYYSADKLAYYRIQNAATGWCLATNARRALYTTASCDAGNPTVNWGPIYYVVPAPSDSSSRWMNEFLLQSVGEQWCLDADAYHAYSEPCNDGNFQKWFDSP